MVQGLIKVGTKFSAPTYTGPGVLPASYTAGTRSLLKIMHLGHGI